MIGLKKQRQHTKKRKGIEIFFGNDPQGHVCIRSLSYFEKLIKRFLQGYYADPAAECQVFHICSDDGTGGLSKFSFLCPNGTIFNQAYFICDWWFNVDCSEAEALAESRNGDLLAAYGEQEADLEAEASTGYGSPVVEAKAAESAPVGAYGAPEEAQDTYGAAAAADSAEYPASDYIYDY